MNKFVKFLSATLAGCMMMMSFAGAANLNAVADEPAEETLTGTASVVTVDGVTDTEFEYTVPVDATEEERAEIARQAAREAVGMNSVGRSVTRDYLLAGGANIPLRSNSWRSLITENFIADGGKVETILSGIQNCSTVWVEINGVYKTKSVRNSDAVVIFYDDEYIRIYEDNPVSVRLKGSPDGMASIVEVYQVY